MSLPSQLSSGSGEPCIVRRPAVLREIPLVLQPAASVRRLDGLLRRWTRQLACEADVYVGVARRVLQGGGGGGGGAAEEAADTVIEVRGATSAGCVYVAVPAEAVPALVGSVVAVRGTAPAQSVGVLPHPSLLSAGRRRPATAGLLSYAVVAGVRGAEAATLVLLSSFLQGVLGGLDLVACVAGLVVMLESPTGVGGRDGGLCATTRAVEYESFVRGHEEVLAWVAALSRSLPVVVVSETAGGACLWENGGCSSLAAAAVPPPPAQRHRPAADVTAPSVPGVDQPLVPATLLQFEEVRVLCGFDSGGGRGSRMSYRAVVSGLLHHSPHLPPCVLDEAPPSVVLLAGGASDCDLGQEKDCPVHFAAVPPLLERRFLLLRDTGETATVFFDTG